MRRRFAGSAEIRRQPLGRTSQLRLSTLQLSQCRRRPFQESKLNTKTQAHGRRHEWASLGSMKSQQKEPASRLSELFSVSTLPSFTGPRTFEVRWRRILPQDSYYRCFGPATEDALTLRGDGLLWAAFPRRCTSDFQRSWALRYETELTAVRSRFLRRPLRHRKMESHPSRVCASGLGMK